MTAATSPIRRYALGGTDVMPSHLKEYLGCELAQIQPADLVDLRALYNRDSRRTYDVARTGSREERGHEQLPPVLRMAKCRRAARQFLKDKIKREAEKGHDAASADKPKE